MRRIAILGGGISGLTAAWTCSRHPDVQPTLLEGSDRLGGVLDTVHEGPYLVERSADNFATLIPDALELSRECGLEQELIHPNTAGRQAFVLHRGRILPIPAGFSLMQPTRISSIIATHALSWSAKFRMLRELWVAKRHSHEDESLEAFVTRRLGREVFENLVEPIVSGIFTADPKTLSMAATMPQFVAMEKKYGGLIRGHLAARRQDAAAAAKKASGARYDQFVAPKDGMSAWIAAIASQLPTDCVQLGTPVRRLERVSLDGKSRWTIETSTGMQAHYDGVICALPATATASLLQDVQADAAAIVGSIPYASSVVVAVIVNKADIKGRIDGFGLIVPHKEKRDALAISYTSNKYPGRVPDSEILLRIFFGGALRPDVVDFPDERLLSMAHNELRDLLGWQANQANWQSIIRWRQAMPQYLVGHVQRMQELRRLLDTLPGLKLCGAAYGGVGIPQCVRGARQAVRELLATNTVGST